MLLELYIENYAVVEKLRVRFGQGLNVLTGETGSGKSIVVDALGLLFGGRASAEMLRTGADRARISGLFDSSEGAASVLADAGFDMEEPELLVERELLAGGKSRAFVGSRPVTVALLRDLAPHLGDIHGQHDQQLLFSTDSQLSLLDGFAANGTLLQAAGKLYREWKACAVELEEIELTEKEKLRLLDLWTFQREEIGAAALKPGEEERLETDRRVLQNVGRLQESVSASYEALYDAPNSAYASIHVALKKLEEAGRIDESLQAVRETLQPVDIAVQEAASALRDYVDRLEADPEKLEEVESRLAGLQKLKRKYGGTVEDILAFAQQVNSQIAALETANERKAAIEKRRAELEQEFKGAAADLTRTRTDAADRLSKNVQTELKSLGMAKTVFAIKLSETAWSPTGTDSVAFLLSPNPGEDLKPLEKIASGGELSRMALALKTCVTGGEGARTLVFDEVDAGIGGVAAESVGRRLKALARVNQVLCVTHLAQIAGFGDHHFVVEKQERGGRTSAAIEELSGEARTREIGRMLSGERLTPEALKHAEQLIQTGD